MDCRRTCPRHCSNSARPLPLLERRTQRKNCFGGYSVWNRPRFWLSPRIFSLPKFTGDWAVYPNRIGRLKCSRKCGRIGSDGQAVLRLDAFAVHGGYDSRANEHMAEEMAWTL